MAPFTEEEEEIRRCFKTLRMLQTEVQELGYYMRHVKNYQWECLMITPLQLKKVLHTFVWGRF